MLLVEDDDRVRWLMERVLEERGHVVASFPDGEAAWGACQGAAFDLALLDVVLPRVDGLTLCRRLREQPGGAATAILVVTGVAASANLASVLAAGADDYLAKPFELEELDVRLTMLERLAAERVRRAEAAELQARLLKATRRVAASLDLAETLDAIAEEAHRLTEADVASVAQPAADGAHWALLASRGPLAPPPDAPPTLVGHGAFASALRTGQPAMIADYAAPGAPPLGPRSREAGIRSSLAVPLRAGDRVLGVFGAQSRTPAHFTPEHQRLLEGLAEAAALAVAHAQEVAHRREAEAALRASEERYRLVTEAVPLGIWEWEFRTGRVAWSGAGRGVLGYEWGETIASAEWWHDVVHPEERDAVQARAAAALGTGADRLANELRVRRADGSYARVSVLLLRLFRDAAGAPLRALGMIQDVTSLRTAEAEHDRLTEALARAEERERVAMDLHDVGVQTLFGLSMRLEAARRRAGPHPELDAAALAAKDAMNRLRGHVHALRARTEPRADGLQGAFAALADDMTRGTGFAVTMRLQRLAPEALGPEVAEHVLHVAREALTNAARHSGAAGAAVRLARRGGRAVLTVRDAGRGFDPAHAREGMGLANMRRRAELIGGVVTVGSAPGRGTVVRLEVPLAPADAVAALEGYGARGQNAIA